MIKKIWILLLVPVGLYSITEEAKKTLKKIWQELQETVLNRDQTTPIWDGKVLLDQKEYLKKETKALETAFEEKIINDPMWNTYLTSEGQQEFLECVKNPANCNLPLVAELSTGSSSRGNYSKRWHYDNVTRDFCLQMEENKDNNEKVNMVIDKFLEKYLTEEGRRHFCTPIPSKAGYFKAETALKTLRKMFEVLYRASLLKTKYSIMHFNSNLN